MSFEDLQPKDILTPSATIVGFILASIGIITSFNDVLRSYVTLLIIVILFFLVTTILTLFSSLTKKVILWKYAQISYLASWSLVAITTLAILLKLGFDIDIFSIKLIPEIPNKELAISLIVSVVVSFVSALIGYQIINKINTIFKEIENLKKSHKPRKLRKSTQEIVVELLETLIKIENRIRSLARPELHNKPIHDISYYLVSKAILPETILRDIRLLWAVRNKLVHEGLEIPRNYATSSLDLSKDVYKTLNNVKIPRDN